MNELTESLQNEASVINKISSLSSLEITDDLTMKIVGLTCVMAAAIAAICFVCSLGFNYFRSGLKNLFNPEEPSEFPNYMEIARGVLFIIMISVYPIIAVALTGTIEFFNKMSSPVQENNVQMAKLAQEYSDMIKLSYDEVEQIAMESAKEGKTGNEDDQAAAEIQLKVENDADVDKEIAPIEDTNSDFSLKQLLNLLNPLTWIPLALQAVCHLLFGIVRIIIGSITAILFKFFIIIGPLAIAFSILPVFEKQLSLWFGTVLNTGFVFTSMNILDHISLGLFKYILNDGMDQGDLLVSYVLIFDITLLVVYLSVFWLTSKYVGKGDAGRMITKMVTMGTAAAALMTGGAGAAAAGGNFANAVKSMDNTIGGK